MSKVFLVIKREYLARVRKKSFLLATLITPLIFPAILGVFLWISFSSEGGDALKIIEVVDESDRFFIESNGEYAFSYSSLPQEEAKKLVQDGDRFGFLYIPKVDVDAPEGIRFYSKKTPSVGLVGDLEERLSNRIGEIRLYELGIDPKVIRNIKTPVSISSITLEEGGDEKVANAGVNYGLGFFLGILIYTFIFVYGTQIMQGVIEEKSSRIIEILV